jgi:hypothetical protein
MIETIGSALLMLVALFVFLAMAVLFIIRYIVFILLLIISPLGYMASVIPGLQNISKKYWDTLIGQALFAPIFMIMMWIVLTLVGSGGLLSTASTNAQGAQVSLGASLAQPAASSMGLLLNYFIVIGFLIITIIVSKDYATKGGIVSSKLVNTGTSYAGGVLFGGASMIGRNTIGAAASRLAESQRFQDLAGSSRIAQSALNLTRKTADSSFDVRASRAGKLATDYTGIDVGKAREGGFNKTLADKTAKQEKFVGSLRGNLAKENYATRKASGTFTRGGSRSSGNTIFGVMGRSNRIVASRVLNTQLTAITTARDGLQTRLDSLNDQLTKMTNEEATIMAAKPPTPAQTTRLAVLHGPATNRNSLAYVNGQITTLDPQLNDPVTGLIARAAGMQTQITTLGITNPANPVVTNIATGATRPSRADEQQY